MPNIIAPISDSRGYVSRALSIHHYESTATTSLLVLDLEADDQSATTIELDSAGRQALIQELQAIETRCHAPH